jgi:hypothetical protein
MRQLTLPYGTTVKVFSSIFEFRAGRHAEFQHYLVRDSGIGSGAEAIERHFAQTTALLAAGRTDEAGDALALLHYAFMDTLDKFNPKQLAFGCLVAEVDGRRCVDFTEDGLRRLITELSTAGLTQGMVEQEIAEVKKNLKRS